MLIVLFFFANYKNYKILFSKKIFFSIFIFLYLLPLSVRKFFNYSFFNLIFLLFWGYLLYFCIFLQKSQSIFFNYLKITIFFSFKVLISCVLILYIYFNFLFFFLNKLYFFLGYGIILEYIQIKNIYF